MKKPRYQFFGLCVFKPFIRNCLSPILLVVCACHFTQGAVTHTWTGDSANNSYWNTSANWEFGSKPEGNANETLVFPAGAKRLSNTNDILPVIFEGPKSFAAVLFQDGAYKLHGNTFEVGMIYANQPSTEDATIYCNLAISQMQARVLNNGATLTLAGDMRVTNYFMAVGLGDCVVSGIISGPGEVSKSAMEAASGELQLKGLGANTYTGITSVNHGTLRLDRYILLPGPMLIGTVAVPGNLSISSAGSGPPAAFVVLERNNQIADTSGVHVGGKGQLDLHGHNDTIRGLSMFGGSVTTGAGTLTLAENITIGYNATPAIIAGNIHFAPDIPHSFNLQTSSQLDLSANVSASTDLTISGGEVTLAGSNSFTGKLNLSGTAVAVVNNHALGSGVPGVDTATVLSDTLLKMDHVTVSNEMAIVKLGYPDLASVIEGAGTCAWRGDIALTNNAKLWFKTPYGNELTIDGSIFSNSTVGQTNTIVTRTGPGTLILKGDTDNAFAMAQTGSGTLQLGKTTGRDAIRTFLKVGEGSDGVETAVVEWLSDEQVRDTAAIHTFPASLLALNGNKETIGSLTGSGAVNLGSGSLVVSNDGDDDYKGNIRGGRKGFDGGNLIKEGTGVWTLSGSNSHWGLTLVNKGTLIVNGWISNSPVQVYRGAKLGGSGGVHSLSFSGVGGILAPGTSAGAFKVATLASLTNGIFQVELKSTTPGTGHDQLITGEAPILSGQRSFAELEVQATPTFAPGASFVIINNQSALPVSGTFLHLANKAKFSASGQVFEIRYDAGNGNDVALTKLATPAVTNCTATISEGHIRVMADGYQGVQYVLEASDSLASLNWVAVATNTASASGELVLEDLAQATLPMRFYRVVSP